MRLTDATLLGMNDISQKISEIVADTMASKQAEISGLLDKLREDIDALQQAVSGFPGSSPQPGPRRGRAAAPATPKPRRRRKASPAPAPVVAQAASSRAPAQRKRREKTPEEREAISKRMTAYWQRKREEKAAKG